MPKPSKSLSEIQAELGIGAEVVIRAKIAGFVAFGREVQLELPGGLLIYAPIESMSRFTNE